MTYHLAVAACRGIGKALTRRSNRRFRAAARTVLFSGHLRSLAGITVALTSRSGTRSR